MSHSKGTTNYNLPLFTKDDRPTWLTDFNFAMQEVDTVVKGLSDKVKAGGLPTTGGTMDGNINMNEHALTNVQEVELPSAGNGLYVGAVVQPTGTTGARLTGVGNANAAAFVKPDTQDTYVPVRVGTPQTGDDAVNKNSLNGTLASYLKKTGGTLTGALILSGAPTEDLQAATKKYVDDNAGSGGVSQEYVDAQVATRLPLNGGTMTGDLVLVSDVPATEHSATSKNYVLGVFGSCVPKSGGTMTGPLTLSGAPASDLQAATKKYVDDKAGNSEETIIDWGNTTVAAETLFCTAQQFAGKSTLIIYADFSEVPVNSATRAQIGGVGPTITTQATWAYNANYKSEYPMQIGQDSVFIASYNSSSVTSKAIFKIKADGVYLAYGCPIEATNGAKIKVCLK